jgi:recombination protein RecR
LRKISYPEQLTELVDQLRRLPGIGPRSAERMALWLISGKPELARDIGSSILTARENLGHCPRCGFFITGESCRVCEETSRDLGLVCVVEHPTDVVAIERSGAFSGTYHCLGGRIAPLDHIGPEELRIEPLLKRVEEQEVREVVLALSSDVEGEATANYLREILIARQVTVTRPAQGLPAGGGLDNADEVTLSRAMAGRTPFS